MAACMDWSRETYVTPRRCPGMSWLRASCSSGKAKDIANQHNGQWRSHKTDKHKQKRDTTGCARLIKKRKPTNK